MFLDLDLEDEASSLKALAEVIENIEAGLGADGGGHGKLKPPSEELALGDGRIDLLGGGVIQEGDQDG